MGNVRLLGKQGGSAREKWGREQAVLGVDQIDGLSSAMAFNRGGIAVSGTHLHKAGRSTASQPLNALTSSKCLPIPLIFVAAIEPVLSRPHQGKRVLADDRSVGCDHTADPEIGDAF